MKGKQLKMSMKEEQKREGTMLKSRNGDFLRMESTLGASFLAWIKLDSSIFVPFTSKSRSFHGLTTGFHRPFVSWNKVASSVFLLPDTRSIVVELLHRSWSLSSMALLKVRNNHKVPAVARVKANLECGEPEQSWFNPTITGQGRLKWFIAAMWLANDNNPLCLSVYIRGKNYTILFKRHSQVIDGVDTDFQA